MSSATSLDFYGGSTEIWRKLYQEYQMTVHLFVRQIHLFSETSSTGYGTVAYLGLCGDRNRIHCTFLMGKAHLASINLLMCHTDSTAMLRYIGNEQRRFHIFVANWVQLIRDQSSLSQ